MTGDKIKNAREQKSWSQGDLANALRITRQAVSAWETGRKIPGGKNLIKLATALGVTTDYLMGRSDSPSEARPAPSFFGFVLWYSAL